MIKWIKRKLSNTVARCAVKIMMEPGDKILGAKILGAVECRGSIYIITMYSIYAYVPDDWNYDGIPFPSITRELYTK